jgi:hypothetical protein
MCFEMRASIAASSFVKVGIIENVGHGDHSPRAHAHMSTVNDNAAFDEID